MATDPSSLIAQLLSPQGVNSFQQGQQQYQDTQAQQQSNQQALQLGAMKLQQAQQAQVQAQQQAVNKAQAWAAYQADPSHENLTKLYFAAPDEAEALSKGASLLDEDAKTSQTTQNGVLYNLADGGSTDQLTTQVQSLINAEQKAGLDTSQAQGALQDLQSGDPARIASARTSIKAQTRINLAALGAKGFSIDPAADEGSGFTLDAGQTRYDANGKVIASAAEKPKYEWDSARGAFFLVPGTGGGGQTSSGGAPSSGGGAPQTIGDVGQIWQNMVRQEGGTNPDGSFRTSPAGARGPAQLMPNTINTAAQLAGLSPQLVATDPQANLAAGKAYFQKQLSDFGDPALAAAAYNAGPGRVRAAQAQYGANWLSHLPVETQNYVANVVGGQGGTATASVGGPPQVVQVAPPKAKESDDFGGDPSLSGPAYLASLPAGKAAYLRAIAAGQVDPPKAGTKYGNQVAEAAVNAFPDIDTSTFPARKAARTAFTGNGKAAQIGGSISRLGYHLNDAYEASQQLSGPNLGWSPLSNLVAGGLQSGEQADAAKYDATLPFIAGEVQKLVKNGAATEGEGNKIMANLSRKQPTDVRNAALAEIAKLATGAFQPYRQQWESAFPGTPPPVDISPLSAQIYDHIINGKPPVGVDNNGHATQPSTPPAPPPGGHQIGFYQGKPVFQLPNGKRVVAQ